MKLRNKKTGEIGELNYCGGYIQVIGISINTVTGDYTSLAELTEEWEDYEEDKRYWYIDVDGEIMSKGIGWFDEAQDNIGNRFETEEEAEKAVDKLKAWKRLKNGGITFKNWTINQTGTIDCFATWGNKIPPSRKNPTLLDDLDLLFSGEDD